MEKLKKISVCMATYNGQEFITEQINSILLQLSEVDELIISDDGSTDNTISIVESISDSRIKIIYSPNTGVIKNFENALLHATGDFIILSDQDDVWLDGRLNIAKEKLLFNDLVIVGYQTVNSKLISFNSQVPNASLSFIKTLIKNGYLGCSMAFRASILPSILPFPKGIYMHDWWIALICLWKFKVHIEPGKYFLYRRHGNNASFTGEKSKFPISKRIKMRIFILFSLFIHLFK